MNRQSVPDNEELTRLIHAAYEALPAPDEERLAAVNERLQAQAQRRAGMPRRRRQGWYWLWLLLAGGTAAAAWWVNEYINVEQESARTERQEVMQSSAPSGDSRAERPPDRNKDQDEKQMHFEQRSPVIYKREGHQP